MKIIFYRKIVHLIIFIFKFILFNKLTNFFYIFIIIYMISNSSLKPCYPNNKKKNLHMSFNSLEPQICKNEESLKPTSTSKSTSQSNLMEKLKKESVPHYATLANLGGQESKNAEERRKQAIINKEEKEKKEKINKNLQKKEETNKFIETLNKRQIIINGTIFNLDSRYNFYESESKNFSKEVENLVYKGVLTFKGVENNRKDSYLIFLDKDNEIIKISITFLESPKSRKFFKFELVNEINSIEINSITKEINGIYSSLKSQKKNPDIIFLKEFMKSYIDQRIQKLEINESQKNYLKGLIIKKNAEFNQLKL